MINTKKTVYIVTGLLLIIGFTSALDINSSQSLNYYNDGGLDFQVETTGVINAQNNLNMNGQNITNFFDSACTSGEVVADVNDDGTSDCVNVTAEVQDTYVNRAGDTMNGTLDMNSNAILNIDWANSDDGTGSGLDADLLDGVERANLNWGDMALAQTDISLADVGAADTNLDMNGNAITNIDWANSDNPNTDASTKCSGADYLAGDGTCNVDSYEADTTIADNQGLPDVLNNGNSANQALDMNGYDIQNARRLEGDTHEFRFDSSDSWVELTDSSGTRSDIVLKEVYFDGGMGWVNTCTDVTGGGGLCDGNDAYDPDTYIGDASSHVAGGNLDMGGNAITNTGMVVVPVGTDAGL